MRRKIKLFSAIISVIFALPFMVMAADPFEVSQDTAEKESTNLYGGYAEAMEIFGNQIWLGTNSAHGLFYLDSGATEFASPSQEGIDFGEVAYVQAAGSNLFVIGGIDLYKYDGTTWTDVADDTVTNAGSVMTYGNGVLMVGMRDGNVVVSTDDGTTWNSYDIVANGSSIADVDTSDTDGVTYAVAGADDSSFSVYKSSDGGQTWTDTGQATSSGASHVATKDDDSNFVVLVDTTGAVVNDVTYSTDGGATWGDFLTNFTEDQNMMGELKIAGDTVYIGRFYTTDDGATWGNLQDSIPGTALTCGDLGVNADGSIIACDADKGVAYSYDSGATFSYLYDGIQALFVDDLAFVDNSTAYLSTYAGTAKSTNLDEATPSWSIVGNVTSAGTAVYAFDANNIVSAMSGTPYYSTDGGTTFTAGTGSSSGSIVDFAYNGSTLYMASTGATSYVDMSTDNGVTWTNYLSGSYSISAIDFLSDGRMVVGLGDNEGIYVYDGTTWASLSTEASTYSISDVLVDGSNVYAAATGGTSSDFGVVFQSTDSGATWNVRNEDDGLASDGSYHTLGADPNINDVIIVSSGRPASEGYLYKSADGGVTWDLFYTGLKDEDYNALVFTDVGAGATRTILASSVTRGLLTGTNTGCYAMQSKAKVTLKQKKKKIKKGKRTRLTAKVKDVATLDGLNKVTVKLYSKNKKKKGSYKKIKTKKANKKGTVTFRVKPKKTKYYQARFKPKKSKWIASYGTSAVKSPRKRVKVTK